jgi:hypothetical protein
VLPPPPGANSAEHGERRAPAPGLLMWSRRCCWPRPARTMGARRSMSAAHVPPPLQGADSAVRSSGARLRRASWLRRVLRRQLTIANSVDVVVGQHSRWFDGRRPHWVCMHRARAGFKCSAISWQRRGRCDSWRVLRNLCLCLCLVMCSHRDRLRVNATRLLSCTRLRYCCGGVHWASSKS